MSLSFSLVLIWRNSRFALVFLFLTVGQLDGRDRKKQSSNTVDQNNLTSKADLVLLVLSRPEATSDREALRQTWGADTKIKVVFIFCDLSRESVEVQQNLIDEHKTYEDIEMFRFPIDDGDVDYLLILNALKWAYRTFPTAKSFGKANSDIWLNVPKLLRMVGSLDQETHWMLGHFIDGNSSEVSDLYGGNAPGRLAVEHLWVVSRPVVPQMINLANALGKTDSMSDTVLTGYFPLKLKTRTFHIESYANLWDLDTSAKICYREKFVVLHGVFYNQKYDVHFQSC